MAIYKVVSTNASSIVYCTEDDLWDYYKQSLETKYPWGVEQKRESVIYQMTKVPMVQQLMQMMIIEADPIEALEHTRQTISNKIKQLKYERAQLLDSALDVFHMEYMYHIQCASNNDPAIDKTTFNIYVKDDSKLVPDLLPRDKFALRYSGVSSKTFWKKVEERRARNKGAEQ